MIEKFDIFKDENNSCYQLRTKTYCYTLEFDDQEKEDIFLQAVSEITKKGDISLKELKSKLLKKSNEEKVLTVLKTLNDYDLLPKEFSTEFATPDTGNSYGYSYNRKQVKDFVLAIFGQGELAKKIKLQAAKESFKEVNLYSYNEREDIDQIVKGSDFLIVDASEWSPYHVEIINKSALKYNVPWLFVGGIEETSLKVGPLFYGSETGCYNCLISRIKSNHDNPTFLSSYEEYLRQRKMASKPDIAPSSDILYNILANLAMLETMKFIEEWSLPVTWRTVINIDIKDFNLTKHTLLKKPFCEVCKPKLEYNPAPWLEEITLK